MSLIDGSPFYKPQNFYMIALVEFPVIIKSVLISEGNKDPNYNSLDLCFGGRRKFVGGSYVDFGKFRAYSFIFFI